VSTAPLFGKGNVRFNPTEFGWIGSMNDEKSVCAVWHTAPVKTFADLKTTPVPMSGLGPGGDTDVYTNLLNNEFGTKMKLVTGFATTDEQRQILDILLSPQIMGRPLLTPPHVPADRLAALRAAFNASMTDPQFLAEAKKINLEISMVSGERIEAMIKHLYAMPKAIVAKAAQAVESPAR
jgi:tripartite-type tricarboxylate transporter receptor subunit TctC